MKEQLSRVQKWGRADPFSKGGTTGQRLITKALEECRSVRALAKCNKQQVYISSWFDSTSQARKEEVFSKGRKKMEGWTESR